MRTHQLLDPGHPIRHGMAEDLALREIIRRRRIWIEAQPEDVQRRYCEHTSYVGADASLAYCCPFCPDPKDAKPCE